MPPPFGQGLFYFMVLQRLISPDLTLFSDWVVCTNGIDMT